MNDAILVADPDASAREMLCTLVKRQGYRVLQAVSGQDAIEQLENVPLAAILLELDLPDGDGLDLIDQLRILGATSILVVSNRRVERDKVEALDRGANDYINKPFREGELLARLRAALRTTHHIRRSKGLDVGTLQVCSHKRRVFLRGREVTLTPTEFTLLQVMARRAGAVVPHRQLMNDVWGSRKANGANHLRVYMHQLRRKLEQNPDAPELLLTVPGVGYRLEIPA